MKSITKEAILDKTHYGLKVYAKILQCYYPGETVLSLSGRVCKPAKNPFNNDKRTLMVKEVDNCARHTDSENAIPDGDVFDFAALHFKMGGDQLLHEINEKMYLHIGEERLFHTVKKEPVNSVIIPQFSYFCSPVTNTLPQKKVNLRDIYAIIKSNSFKHATHTLRQISEPKEARKYKAKNFDYVTFSGTFSQRKDDALMSHSGLLTIDFDHIKNLQSIKEKLLVDKYFETEIMFISPSGNGLKWIIPIDLNDATHKEYFQAVSNYIRETYHLEADPSGKDVSRPCFIPHDAEVYLNPKYL